MPDPLEVARKHILISRQIVFDQKARIASLAAADLAVEEADRLLKGFEECQRSFEDAYRQLLARRQN